MSYTLAKLRADLTEAGDLIPCFEGGFLTATDLENAIVVSTPEGFKIGKDEYNTRLRLLSARTVHVYSIDLDFYESENVDPNDYRGGNCVEFCQGCERIFLLPQEGTYGDDGFFYCYDHLSIPVLEPCPTCHNINPACYGLKPYRSECRAEGQMNLL